VGGYDLLIDYNREPPVELSEDDAAWLRSHLQKGGAVHRRPDLTDQ
jgi:hypothetical protein